jgi:DUF2971 family protein
VVIPEQQAKNVTAFESLVKVAAFGGGPIQPLTDWYSLAPIQPTGGLWYFSCKCQKCHRMFPLFQDFSDGDLGNPFRNYGVRVTCLFCNANLDCASEDIKSAQWPLEPRQTPPRGEYANRVPRTYVDDPEYRPVAGPLHHYTSLTALLSIIKSKCLWATNVRYLNDKSESEIGLARMRQIAEEARRTAKGIDSEILDYIVEWLGKPLSESAAVYVLSFSEAHNQLSQWRGYTSYGQGVCLSIDSGLLVRRMQAQGWTFQNCRYGQASQLAWADAILSRFRREAATSCVGLDKGKRCDFGTVFQSCLSDLLQVSATIKHDGFAEEREVRFISPMIDAQNSSVSHRPGNSIRIPYVNFHLADETDRFAIHEVMVGPGPEQLHIQSIIAKALRDAEVKGPCLVSLCNIPYREI